MKKILVAALFFTMPALAIAQKNGSEHRASLTPQQRAEKHTARVDAIVSLTPEQRTKISAENLRAADAMQPHINAVREERKAIREIGKQRRQAYTTILTPDQMERLKTAHTSKRKIQKERGGRYAQPKGGTDVRVDAPSR